MKEKRLFEPIDSRQMENLKVFHEVARALTSNLELEPLLRAILGQMEDFFGPEQWSLLMVDEEKNDLYYALTSGVDQESIRDVRIEMGAGVAGRVAQTGLPLVIPDVSTDRNWAAYAAEHPELNLLSIASLPIRHGATTLGVLQLHNSKLDLLPDSSISFLRVLCDYAAIALHNARNVKRIHELTITDDTTGLFNGRYLFTMLEQEIASASNPRVRPIQPHFSLLFLDLDHFKTVNDTHGHLVGSRLLADVGGLIKRVLGPNHAGFRYGGDEFVGLLRSLDKPAAIERAEYLRSLLAAQRFVTSEGHPLHITASMGLATYPQDGDNLHALIRAADTMMYAAKANGRNRLEVADSNAAAVMAPIKGSRHS
jgi:diguanylate cyclase (GGDEF)-like protein